MTGRHPDPMITVEALAARLGAPDLRILDASWVLPGVERDPKSEFFARRIPGAQFFDIDEIADTASPLPHMAPSPEKFASRMRKMGVGDGSTVVVYDSAGVFSAARVWWTFRLMGHEDVFVLDGGLPAWIAAGFEVEDGQPAPRQERHFTPRLRSDLVRSMTDMRRLTDAGTAAILDARPPGRFAGVDPEPRPGLRGGHMPGARNVPVSAVVGADGTLKSSEELRATFAAAGVEARKPVATTCGSGVTAAILTLALARIGRWDVGLYDGSWAEWGAAPDAPVVTGA
ncbi:MAG: 3-mercaptopyruvate sulfurtransferase [Caulobacterales bacterium]